MTLKQFRAQFTVGRRLEVLNHWIERYRGSIRTIDKVQVASFRFVDDKNDKPSWSPFPKKSEIEFHDDGSFTIRPADLAERGGHWRLRFVDETATERRAG